VTPAQKLLRCIIGALALVGLIGAALYGAYSHGVTVTNAARDAQWETAVATQQAKLADAVQAARTEEQRLQREANQVGIDARKKNAAADADGLGVDAAGDRLHVQAGKLAAGAGTCTGNTGTADRGASATRAAMVHSRMLERSVARIRELGRGIDDARRRRLSCGRTYAALTGPMSQAIACSSYEGFPLPLQGRLRLL
jgi:hypothetical protein